MPGVERLPELREQDFGSLEGLDWRKPLPPVESGWVDPETPDSVSRRANQFLDVHLFPAVEKLVADGVGGEASIVVAAHGVTLGHLVSALVAKFRAGGCPVYGLATGEAHQHWRNTGYFECLVEAPASASAATGYPGSAPARAPLAPFPSGLKVTVERMNCVDHLAGLTRTKGGIGSAEYDSSQTTLDGFTKKGSSS